MKRPRHTDEFVAIVRHLAASGLNDTQIAARTGRRPHQIQRLRARRGIPAAVGRGRPAKDRIVPEPVSVVTP